MLLIVRRLLALVALLGASSAFAQSYTYSVYIDADNNPSTGCSVSLPGGTLTGAETVLTATINAGSPPQVTSVTSSTCSGGSFGAPVPVGIAAVSVGAGSGGGTEIEISAATASLVAPSATTVRLYVVARSANGSDVLLNSTGAAGGAPILFAVNTPVPPGPVIPAPLFGVPAIALLILAMLALGSRAARRRWMKRVLAGFVLLSSVAGAAIFNWAGINPLATDPTGDSTSGETAIDLRAFYTALLNGNLYFRIDVVGNLAPPVQAPVANPVSATVAFNSTANPIALSIGGGAAASVAVSTPPGHGSATAAGTSITYTPNSGYSGADTFQYTATNVSGTSAPATVTIMVNPQAPIAGAVTTSVGYNSTNNPITLNITGGAPTSVAVSTAPGHGSATAIGTSITYTPNSGYSGTDTFQYTATNVTGTSAAATVTITVNPQAPIAGPASATVAYNSTNNAITLNLTGGTATSVAVSTAPGHGSATAIGTSITYTPNSGYSGTDTFQYTATNVTGTSAAATVTITVNPQAPVAGPVSATVGYNSTNNAITLNITGGAPASVAVSTAATHGTATATGTSITYTPTAGYSGADSFQYTATNAGGTSAAATVTIAVNPQAPIAGPVSATVAYNSTNNAITLNLTGGLATSVAVSTAATHGTATAAGTSITYTPTSGYSGTDTFQYTATNVTGTSAAATVTITVNPQAPSAGPVSATVGYNSTNNAITLSITGGTPTSVAVSTAATHGTATAAGTSITYTPTSGYSGTDTFQYTATNAGGTSAAATVTITVNPPAPITGPASATVAYNSTNNAITLNLSGGAAASVAVSTAAAHGTATATATGTSITYTPAAGYSGTDTFQYTATNVTGTSAAATVTITVNPQAPIAAPVSATVAYNSTNIAITLSITGGAPASVAVSTAATHGTATATGTSITYTPDSGYSGTDTFDYTATNAGGTSVPATVTITVTPQVPIAGPASATVAYNSTNNAITLNLTGGTATSVAVSTAAAHGTATAAGTSITYTPSSGYSGPDSFQYTAMNAGGTSAAATVTISVNRAPTFTSPTSAGTTILINQPFTLSLAATGYPTAMMFSAGGSLPPGITFTGSALTGTPTAGGTFPVVLGASNGVSPDASTTFTIVVNACSPITVSGTLANGQYQVAYGTQTFTQSGGTGAITWSATGLPAGLTINASGGVSGTPTNTGTSNVVVTATDSSGCTGSTTVNNVTISPVARADSYTTLGNTPLVVGTGPATPYVASATNPLGNDGGPGTLSVSLGATVAHGTITLNAGGTFTYTPTANYTGSDSFTYTLTDGNGMVSTPATVSLTVGPNKVWYVNGAAGTNGNGVASSPFNTLASANTAHAAGDVIFIQSGATATATPGAISLKQNATLWGQGVALPAIGGITLQNAAATSNPKLAATVTLAGNGVTVSSLDIVSTTATGLTNSGTITGATVQNGVNVITTTGVAVNLANASGSFTLQSVSANGAPRGISVSNLASGAFNVTGVGTTAGSGGTIANSTSAAAGDGAVVLTSVSAASLGYMSLNSGQASGIVATDVASLTVASSTFSNFVVAGALVGSNTTLASTNGGAFNLHDNTFTGTGGSAVQIAINNAGTWTGHLRTNTIGSAGAANSGSASGEGIDVFQYGSGALTVDVSNNNLYQIKQSYGISAGTQNAAGKLDLTLKSNTVQMIQASSLDAITVATNSDGSRVCLNASANTAAAAGQTPANGWGYNAVGMSVLQNAPTSAAFQIQGYGGAAADANAVQSFLEGGNTLSGPTAADKSAAVINPGPGFVSATCAVAP